MTGPEHYRKAEELVSLADDVTTPASEESLLLAMAQVHATLALAAATALSGDADGMHIVDIRAWNDAVGGAS